MTQIVKLNAQKGNPEVEIAVGPTAIFQYDFVVFDQRGQTRFNGVFSTEARFPQFPMEILPTTRSGSFRYFIAGTTVAKSQNFQAEAKFFQQGIPQASILLFSGTSDVNGAFAFNGNVEVNLV